MRRITQRSALLEDSLREMADDRREGAEALRLDEADLLLTLAAQRLQLAGDVPGAIRATELADSVLSSLRDPALLNLRQSLAQELAALRAMPKDPKALANGELDALEAVLPQLAAGGPAKPAAARTNKSASGFQRLLDALVQVRPSGPQSAHSERPHSYPRSLSMRSMVVRAGRSPMSARNSSNDCHRAHTRIPRPP